jgi:hypothetical protein
VADEEDEMTTGTWTDVDTQDLEGTNAFRLMPTDALVDRPATGVVVPAAGGFGLCVQYDWVHPDGGPQDGILLA